MAKEIQVLQQTTDEEIINRIHIIRGQKVMLDKDLAEMYRVQTRDLNKAVKRNSTRFPEDFMFQLAQLEFQNLMFQFGTSNRGGTRKLPYAFTEQGVAMLSSVLRSERAVQVNIQIIRVYTKMRQLLIDNKEIWQKIEKIEQSLSKKDEEIEAIFRALKKLLVQEEKPRTKIGFTIQTKQKQK